MPQDPVYLPNDPLRNYRELAKNLSPIRNQTLRQDASYLDLAPHIAAGIHEKYNSPQMKGPQTLGERFKYSMQTLGGFTHTGGMVLGNDPRWREYRDYQTEHTAETVIKPWRAFYRWGEDMMHTISPNEQDPLAALGLWEPHGGGGPNPAYDPNFKWEENLDLWKELTSQVSPMYNDDIRAARSREDAINIVHQIVASEDYAGAWEMWYEGVAQDTTAERWLTHPRTMSFTKHMALTMTDPIAIASMGASIKTTQALAKYIQTAKTAKWTNKAWGAWGASTLTEVGIGVGATYLMAKQRGNSEDEDQYIYAALFAGVLAGGINSVVTVKGIKSRVARVAAANAQVLRKKAIVDAIDHSTPHYSAEDLIRMRNIDPEGYKRAMESAFGKQIEALNATGPKDPIIDALERELMHLDADNPRLVEVRREWLKRRDALLDNYVDATKKSESLFNTISVLDDIEAAAQENLLVAGILEDVGIATKLPDGPVKLPTEVPTPQKTKLNPDADEAFGPAFRFLLMDEQFAKTFPKHREIILRITEGRPSVLDLKDIRALAKDTPEVLAGLDLDKLMRRVANNRKANRQLVQAKNLQDKAKLEAEYSSVIRRTVSNDVGDIIHAADGRVGHVIAVSPSGKTLTVDFGFVREKALRASGQMPRPDVKGLQAEVTSAEAAVKAGKITKAEQVQMKQAQKLVTAEVKKFDTKISKLQKKIEKLNIKLVGAEGRLESARRSLAKFEAEEASRSAGGIPERPKALEAVRQRVKNGEAAALKVQKEIDSGSAMIDDLRLSQQSVSDELFLATSKEGKLVPTSAEEGGKTVGQIEGDVRTGAAASRKQELTELRDALRLEEEAEAAVGDVIPKRNARGRYSSITEYPVETVASTSVAVMRADQVAKFMLDDALGQSLFPTHKSWAKGKTAQTRSGDHRGASGKFVRGGKTTTEFHTELNGYRTKLSMNFRRNASGQIMKGTKEWSVTLTDLDGVVSIHKLSSRTVSGAQKEAGELARTMRIDSAANPERMGALLGARQAAKNMDMYGQPSLAEHIADGNIPKIYSGITSQRRTSLYDVDFIGHGMDSSVPRKGLPLDEAAVGQLRKEKFKEVVESEVATRQVKREDGGVPSATDDLAPLTAQEKVVELHKTAAKKGRRLWRWMGAMGIRGSVLASRSHAMATAGADIFGEGGLALKSSTTGEYMESGTGWGTMGSGGLVPHRRAMVMERLQPLGVKWESLIDEYAVRAGKGIADPKDELYKAVYRFREEGGTLPADTSLHPIIKEASDVQTKMGFDAEGMASDPKLKGFVDDLEGIKNRDDYVMRARHLGKFKQVANDVKAYWVGPEDTGHWVPVTHGVDAITHHFAEMLKAGSGGKLQASADFLARQQVRFYMSESTNTLRIFDDHQGLKYVYAEDFVDEIHKIFQEADRLNTLKDSKVVDIEGGALAANDARDELLAALRKDLGAVEKGVKIAMPRIKLGNVDLKVKYRGTWGGLGGGKVDHLSKLNYFEHDMFGLAARYYTETIASANMRYFLRKRWTETWQPKQWKEYEEVMIRAFEEQTAAKGGSASWFEESETIKKQLKFMENALLARPQYSRLSGLGVVIQTLSNLSVLRALPGFVQAQAPEMQAAAYANGYMKVARRIPILNKIVNDAALGRLSYKKASDLVNAGLGMGMNENRVPSLYATINQVENASPIAKQQIGQTYPVQQVSKLNEFSMQNIPTVSKYGMFAQSQNMSDIFAAQEIHNALVQIARTTDPIRRAKLTQKFVGRDNVRIAQFGGNRKAFDEIIDAVSQEGVIITENLNGLEFTDFNWDIIPQATKSKMHDLTREWIKYYVQRSDDYALPMMFATSELGKISQQFRQFSWGSNLNHLGRGLQARDQRALISVVNQIIGGTLVHVGLGHMRYWNDPARLKEYMSVENVVKGILMRSAYLGMGVDALDTGLYALGQDPYFSYSDKPMSMSVPALQTIGDVVKGGGALYDAAFGEGLTDYNFSRIKRLTAPFDKWLPLEFLWPGLEEGLGVKQ